MHIAWQSSVQSTFIKLPFIPWKYFRRTNFCCLAKDANPPWSHSTPSGQGQTESRHSLPHKSKCSLVPHSWHWSYEIHWLLLSRILPSSHSHFGVQNAKNKITQSGLNSLLTLIKSWNYHLILIAKIVSWIMTSITSFHPAVMNSIPTFGISNGLTQFVFPTSCCTFGHRWNLTGFDVVLYKDSIVNWITRLGCNLKPIAQQDPHQCPHQDSQLARAKWTAALFHLA